MDISTVPRKLRQAKIFTVLQLVGWLSCSVPTVRRRLKQWNAYTSYNCNGRYYTLPDIPRFDANGLWRCRGAFFSRHGNLKQTVSHLATTSPAGLTGTELTEILGVDTRSFLSHLRAGLDLVRERRGRGYIWFAADESIRERQREARRAMEGRRTVLSDAEAVAVLVDLIRHPDSSCLELSRRLKPRLPRATPTAIQFLLSSHGLLKKRGAGFAAAIALRQTVDALLGSVSMANLFPETPEFSFVYEEECCPRCGAVLKVLKTRPRKVATLHIGHFRVRETILFCDRCADRPSFRSRELTDLVPDGCNFGYDITVFVGRALFQRLQTVEETADELAKRNIEISETEVRDLAARFIIGLGIAHAEAAPRLREYLGLNGGYILHLDGTCQKESAHLMTGLDELSGLVLLNAKIPTEKSDDISTFLRDLTARFGPPAAVSCDLSSANLKALAETLPDVPVFLCHFHFLRDIGKDLMGDDYRIIRDRLRRHGPKAELKRLRRELQDRIKTHRTPIERLLSHIEKGTVLPNDILSSLPPDVVLGAFVTSALDAEKEGGGYGFPFDRPHCTFYRQLRAVLDATEALQKCGRLDTRTKKLYDRAVKVMKPACTDPEIEAAADSIERKAEVFDRLRLAMRIAEPDKSNGLNDDGPATDIRTIEAGVEAFLETIKADAEQMALPGVSAMLEQIDKYRDRLFRDPIVLRTPDGERLVQPQRTNNILERFFRGLKRAARKRTGHRFTAKTLDNMLPDVPLVANLHDPIYSRILLDASPTLEHRLARIDRKLINASLARARGSRNGLSRTARAALRKRSAPIRIAIQILENAA